MKSCEEYIAESKEAGVMLTQLPSETAWCTEDQTHPGGLCWACGLFLPLAYKKKQGAVKLLLMLWDTN